MAVVVSRKEKWYFGGVASSMAACCTHPLDLIKVQLQTQQTGKIGIWQTVKIIKAEQGVIGFYNGVSASILRQLTYSTTRFGLYAVLKERYDKDGGASFFMRCAMAGAAGAAGGVVGTPGDLVNVRMQNDIKLPPNQRRNYKHAGDGVYRIIREEGIARLWGGCTMATCRAAMMTIGQLAFYDEVKKIFLKNNFEDGTIVHCSSSSIAASVATLLTQPLDVMKTRMMNAPPGTYKNIAACFAHTWQAAGVFAFYKGLATAWVRLTPHTVLTFVFLEKLKYYWGTPVYKK